MMSLSERQKAEIWMPKKYQDKDTSPERTKVWIEPLRKTEFRKVGVVYYLSRNGLLEHPHFMEVPLSSPQGLYLRDVIKRLNCLRGVGMANLYSWSSKRNYKNGYVWQDLTENDFIHPCNGNEYILKGSQLLEGSLSFKSCETVSTATSKASSETYSSCEEKPKSSNATRKENNSSRSHTSVLDDTNQTLKTYRAKTTAQVTKKATNASTQTVDKRRSGTKLDSGVEEAEELSKEENTLFSPPSNSSTEGRESLDVSRETDSSSTRIYAPQDIRNQMFETERPSGRIKASAVLMQFIMCGSKGVDDVETLQRRSD